MPQLDLKPYSEKEIATALLALGVERLEGVVGLMGATMSMAVKLRLMHAWGDAPRILGGVVERMVEDAMRSPRRDS